MNDTPIRPRLRSLDIARGIAILCMASYHFSWDLEYFHYLEPGTVGSGFFRLYARAIASSFLFMAGFSLFLSHGTDIRWPQFWKRFAMIAGSALAVTIVTWFAMRDGFIFFGILHQIALASLIGLLALRLPAPLLFVAGLAALAAPEYLRSPLFDQPWLWWVGLSQTIPRSNDYVPLLPWIAPFLFGIAVSKLLLTFRIFERFPPKETVSNPVASGFSWAGRHSLSIYLIHQPLLFGLVLGFAQVFPAPPPNPETGYIRSCEIQCSKQADKAFCTAFCGCTFERLKDEDLLTKLQSGAIDVKKDDNITRISGRMFHDCADTRTSAMNAFRPKPISFPLPPFLYAFALLSAFDLSFMMELHIPALPNHLNQILGMMLLICAMALEIWAFFTLWRNHAPILSHRLPARLVTDGPFGLTRNPIYLGYTILMVGIGLMSGNAWFVILVPIAAAVTNAFAIQREELHLLSRFGFEFELYCQKTRRWI